MKYEFDSGSFEKDRTVSSLTEAPYGDKHRQEEGIRTRHLAKNVSFNLFPSNIPASSEGLSFTSEFPGYSKNMNMYE